MAVLEAFWRICLVSDFVSLKECEIQRAASNR